MTITPTFTRRTSTQQAGGGISLLSPTTRCQSPSRPDMRESTTGNWLVRQTAVRRVVKVGKTGAFTQIHVVGFSLFE